MNLSPRNAFGAAPIAAALTLAMTVGASAQVASLASPDETLEPEAAVESLEFEDREEAMLAFAQCMRDNGIDMDDPTAGEGGRFLRGGPGGEQRQIDEFGEEFTVAREACAPILAAAAPEIDPAAQQERLEELMVLAQCIRDNGYPQYPDPALGSDGRVQRTGGQAFQELGIDRRSEAFLEVMTGCRDEIGLEAFGPGGGQRGPGGGN